MSSARTVWVAGWCSLLGGLGWFGLVPAAAIERQQLLSYDAYNRFLALPLLLFTVALSLAPGVLSIQRRLCRVGLRLGAVGAGLLCIGNVIEFYLVLLQDGLNAQAAHEAGVGEHWIGSDIGWIIFGGGWLLLTIGGLLAAVTLRRERHGTRGLSPTHQTCQPR